MDRRTDRRGGGEKEKNAVIFSRRLVFSSPPLEAAGRELRAWRRAWVPLVALTLKYSESHPCLENEAKQDGQIQ